MAPQATDTVPQPIRNGLGTSIVCPRTGRARITCIDAAGRNVIDLIGARIG